MKGSLTAFLKSIDKLGAGAVPSTFTGIDTSAYAPKVATITSTTRCNSSSDSYDDRFSWTRSYKQFMSPYQQEVIDTTLAEFDRQQAMALRDRAIQAELLVVQKVLWLQKQQEAQQLIEQTYKHNY